MTAYTADSGLIAEAIDTLAETIWAATGVCVSAFVCWLTATTQSYANHCARQNKADCTSEIKLKRNWNETVSKLFYLGPRQLQPKVARIRVDNNLPTRHSNPNPNANHNPTTKRLCSRF